MRHCSREVHTNTFIVKAMIRMERFVPAEVVRYKRRKGPHLIGQGVGIVALLGGRQGNAWYDVQARTPSVFAATGRPGQAPSLFLVIGRPVWIPSNGEICDGLYHVCWIVSRIVCWI